MDPHVAEPIPLDPGWCKCGLSLDHPDHLPAPPEKPKVDSEGFLARKRIKDFLDRHGSWVGDERVLKHRNGGRELRYTHAAVDQLTAEEAKQEIIDILWAHCDKGICRGCSADIWWIRNDAGKAVPYSAAGVVHFQDCKARQQFKKGA